MSAAGVRRPPRDGATLWKKTKNKLTAIAAVQGSWGEERTRRSIFGNQFGQTEDVWEAMPDVSFANEPHQGDDGVGGDRAAAGLTDAALVDDGVTAWDLPEEDGRAFSSAAAETRSSSSGGPPGPATRRRRRRIQ